MGSNEAVPNLPVSFLREFILDHDRESPPVRMAAEQARVVESGVERRALLEALLEGPHRETAPLWMLEAAVSEDLGERAHPELPFGPSLELARLALSHASCTEELRRTAVTHCSPPQLGALGTSRASEALALAVAEELRSRGPHETPMTVDLLNEPGTAQVVLQQHGLHLTVFTAAVEQLPTYPILSQGDDDVSTWLEKERAAENAWKAIWKRVLLNHADRHRLLAEWYQDDAIRHIVREHLMGSFPWDVEPGLLEEIALEDLDSFPRAVLITKGCRMRRDGASAQEVRDHLAFELESLPTEERDRIDRFLTDEDSLGMLRYGCSAAISHVERGADGRWAYILNPAQAQEYGRPHRWRASEALLVSLAQKFADQAAVALALWEADPKWPINSAKELRWVRDLLQHLPDIAPEVKAQVRLICRDGRKGLSGRGRYARFELRDDLREARELLDHIENMVVDAPPAPGPTRTAALGAPDQVTVRALANAPDDVLLDYLHRHTGNDHLVEKVLLSTASRVYRREPDFDDILNRHSHPQRALLDLTVNLRRLLGGGPNLREAWASAALSTPMATSEIVRALPAWTALKTRGPQGEPAHQAVTALVHHVLANSAEAWQRFATSPASNSGPTAWLRLGDLLDAAVKGEGWPKPPPGR